MAASKETRTHGSRLASQLRELTVFRRAHVKSGALVIPQAEATLAVFVRCCMQISSLNRFPEPTTDAAAWYKISHYVVSLVR